MTFLTAYLFTVSACIVRALWINRHRVEDWCDVCALLGMCLLWPITFVIELRMWLRNRSN